MTVGGVLALVDEIRPNQYDEKIKITWLSELEGRIFNDIILTHEHELVEDDEGNMVEPTFLGYSEGSEDAELIAPDIYADLYRNYLLTQIDYSNGETDRYTNSMLMFNNSYSQFESWYNRTHKPISKPLRLF